MRDEEIEVIRFVREREEEKMEIHDSALLVVMASLFLWFLIGTGAYFFCQWMGWVK